jgi:hypothetical protein
LLIRILKQFIKYGNYLVDVDFGGRKAICDYVKDKIRLSNEMISRVQESQFKQVRVNTNDIGGTAFYRGIFQNKNVENLFSEDILSLEETESVL